MMMVSLFAKAQPKYLDEWEKLTGIKIKTIEYGYTEIPAKIMADAVAKTGQYDIYNHQMYMLPDAVEAGAVVALDDWAARGKPYFEDIAKTLRAEMYYKGKLYTFFTDGDQTILALRQDLVELPEARKAFKAKFGWEPGCPDTWKQWEELASFYQGKKGDKFYGVVLDKDLYGAQEYRAREFGYRWWQGRFISKGKLFFDRNMKPLIDGPEGVEVTKDQVALTTVHAEGHLRLGHAAELSVLRPGQLVLDRHVPLARRLLAERAGHGGEGQGAELRDPRQHGRGQAGAPLGRSRPAPTTW